MQDNDLMISVSGIRGIVGKSLTPELLVRLGHAFGTYVHSKKVVVGRDTRVSGEMAKHAVLSGLLASGCQIIDLGVCATPTLTLAVEREKADGGVMVTASHNPIEWNALKFFRADGLYLNADESRDLLNIYYSGQFSLASWNQLHAIQHIRNADALHVEQVLSILDRNLIRSKKFRVALDCCNGAGCGISQQLLSELGCKVEAIHSEPNGLFPHKPEPVCANLGDLCNFVLESQCHVGFATDPDADRVSVVDESGVYLGEEMALALSMQYALSRRKSSGTVVINMSTSRMTEDVALAAGFEVVRAPAGESNVAERMKEVEAAFGGEGNGGVIDPRVHTGRDAIVGMGLMLEAMARADAPISTLAARLPSYHMIKTKIDSPPGKSRALLRKLRGAISQARVDTRDGLRIDWEDRWVQLRASNTEPIMRIIAEAREREAAQALIDDFTALALSPNEPVAVQTRHRRPASVV
jgi:phosphomannomutase